MPLSLPVATLIAGGVGAASNLIGGLFNLGQQKSEQEWQRHFAYNSAQIRAADLEAAGLSKTLAAGSPASPGTSVSPQMAPPNILQEMGAAAAIGKTRAETELTQTIKDNKQVEGRFIEGIMTETTTEKRLANQLNRELLGIRIKTAEAAAESARHQVNKDYYEAIAAQVAPQLAQADLTRTEADALLKDATRAVQNVLGEQKRYNLKWYQDQKYPTNMGFDPFTRLVHMAAQRILEILERRYAATVPPGQGGNLDPNSLEGRANMSVADPLPNQAAEPWKAP